MPNESLTERQRLGLYGRAGAVGRNIREREKVRLRKEGKIEPIHWRTLTVYL